MAGGMFQGQYGNYLRVRGEYTQKIGICGHPRELPPRARRIQITMLRRGSRPGTTSACAENT
ncbi:hypothetical protein HMPREF0299_5955 [Corynebacterium matruchotii ATCC 14266]|uniref:Uncharacterized protein n=1 Tax=Corynebacterium matruchotii ATCC 14266 TaxID=553207 RepID=E0DCA6_9CORY|nr:hypothetical protein HMPREF0299_5955 [Corynebacterium matruchotii ATCC 14266]